MEIATYREWTIAVRESNGGFVAFLTDATGKKFDKALICMPSPDAAAQCARKFINWWIKCDQKRK